MTRVRRNPDSPDSVRTRLAAIAAERRVDFQAVLTEFATERFLYRLGASAHASRFVLKGATLLTLWQLDRRRDPLRRNDTRGRGDQNTQCPRGGDG